MILKLKISASSFAFVLFFTIWSLWITSCVTRQRELNFSAEIVQNDTAINLNVVSQNQLEILPGIGDEMARRIIEYREQNNGFHRVEELLLVRGMSEKKFLALRPLVEVN